MHHHMHKRACCNPFVIVEKLFWAAAFSCLLFAAHRIADAIKLGGRVKLLDDLGDQLSDDDRALILARAKADAKRL